MKGQASSRQLAVAAFTGLLSFSAATAGEDWRGALLAVPVILAVARCWERLGKDWMSRLGRPAQTALGLLYAAWAVVLSGAILAAAGSRITAPAGRDIGWAVALLWAPVLLLTRKSCSAYGRAAEIFYLAMLAAVTFVLVMGARQIRPERLLKPSDGFWTSVVTASGVGCSAVAAVILWRGNEKEGRPRWFAWSGSLAALTLLMRVVTVGVLGPTLAGEQERPFFLMAVGLGQTARVEGLVGAIWLLADITLAGLLMQCGKCVWMLPGKNWSSWVLPIAGLGTSLLLSRTGVTGFCLEEVLPIVGLVLGGAVPVAYCLGGADNTRFTAKK